MIASNVVTALGFFSGCSSKGLLEICEFRIDSSSNLKLWAPTTDLRLNDKDSSPHPSRTLHQITYQFNDCATQPVRQCTVYHTWHSITPSLPLLSSSLWFGMEVPAMIQFMGQIDLFWNHFY